MTVNRQRPVNSAGYDCDDRWKVVRRRSQIVHRGRRRLSDSGHSD